jgi:hypothetical protein
MNKSKGGFMTKSYSTVAFVPVLFLILVFPVLSADFKAIRDPKPNIIETEKHYVQLEKVKTIDADPGNEMHLYRPLSITVSKDSDDVYIYDNLQAKIFIMDSELNVVKKSFGGEGSGPGELGGTGKRNLVFIQMGRDGKLYAYSPMMRKVLIYDQNGKFIRDIKKIDKGNWKPMADASGNLYNLTVTDKVIYAYNEKKVTLFSLREMEDYFDYLFSTPDSLYLRLVSLSLGDELFTALTIKSRFLLYFPSSSTMVIVENSKNSKNLRLWPKEAMNDYKSKRDEVKNRLERGQKSYNAYLPLFSHLFVDGSDDEVFYLELSKFDKTGNNSLYQFNDKGQLMKIRFVKPDNEPLFIHFKAKKNDRFYVVEDDKLTMYKEMINKKICLLKRICG